MYIKGTKKLVFLIFSERRLMMQLTFMNNCMTLMNLMTFHFLFVVHEHINHQQGIKVKPHLIIVLKSMFSLLYEGFCSEMKIMILEILMPTLSY